MPTDTTEQTAPSPRDRRYRVQRDRWRRLAIGYAAFLTSIGYEEALNQLDQAARAEAQRLAATTARYPSA